MKKGTKIFVFGGLICLLAGGMIMLITGSIGGINMFRTIAARYTFRIHNDHHYGIFWSWDEDDDDFDDFIDFKGNEEFDLSARDIHSLFVDVDGVELNIERREDGKGGVVGLETDFGIDTEYNVENGTLAIKSKNEWIPSSGEITIYVPYDMEWDAVDLYIGAGTADIEDIRAKRLSVNVGAGEASLENVKATEAFNAAVGMGQLEFSGSADCDMNISCGMGQVQLEFGGTAYFDDYDYDVRCEAGSVEIGHTSFGGIGVRRNIDNNSGKHIHIDCGMGEVEIDFVQ